MSDAPIQVGDRVITLQMPGIFVVVARRGRLLEIESDQGVRMRLFDSAVRRMGGPAPEPSAG